MRIILLAGLALASATAATAQPRTITRVIERPNLTIERMLTVDRAAQTLQAMTTVTRASDGAVATKTLERTPIEGGFALAGGFTGFNGATSGFASQTLRTETGATTTGTLTTRGGETLSTLAMLTRTEGGFTLSASASNAAGETVFSRTVTQTGRPPLPALVPMAIKRPRGF